MGDGQAAREFEIKLEIPAQTVSKVMRLPWLWELASGELRPSRLQSIYYDTPNFALLERGVTLRVRRSGATRVQTIKAAVNGAVLPIERDEWEEEIYGEEPELKLTGTPLEDMARKKLRRKLKPCFEIHVDRSAFPIQSSNSAIEVAIDRAHIVGENSASFYEIELELKRGAASEMARVARRIAGEVPASLCLKTKAERGFELRRGLPARPYIGEAVRLSPSARVGEAFQTIGWTSLRHFALNKDAIEAGAVPAAHQMRAGLKRLVTAIAIFQRLLDGPETDAIKSEAEWLLGELDPVCALDLLLEDTLLPLVSARTDPAAMNALCDEAASRRQSAMNVLNETVASDRYRQFVLRTALWLIAAEWSDDAALRHDKPSRRVHGFAVRSLSGSAAQAAKQFRKFSSAPIEHQANVRDALYRLRCAVDFFASLFPAPTALRRRYVRLLDQGLRDIDRLDDIAAHERLRDEFMRSWATEQAIDPATSQKAFAMGFALGQQAPEKVQRAQAVARAGRRLASMPQFWA